MIVEDAMRVVVNATVGGLVLGVCLVLMRWFGGLGGAKGGE